jgi:hypothetical protein
MPMKFKTLAIAATLAAGTSNVALAQYTCPAGYAFSGGICRPVPVPAPAYPSNPVLGAVTGGQTGAASGAAAGGPIGAVVGGAIGTATGTVAGTANALAGVPATTMCGAGFTYYNGYCYPVRSGSEARE